MNNSPSKALQGEFKVSMSSVRRRVYPAPEASVRADLAYVASGSLYLLGSALGGAAASLRSLARA